MIFADFLAGAILDHDDPTILLRSMSQCFKFLPGEQRLAFLHEVSEQATGIGFYLNAWVFKCVGDETGGTLSG
jgi:hypothetical protein